MPADYRRQQENEEQEYQAWLFEQEYLIDEANKELRMLNEQNS